MMTTDDNRAALHRAEYLHENGNLSDRDFETIRASLASMDAPSDADRLAALDILPTMIEAVHLHFEEAAESTGYARSLSSVDVIEKTIRQSLQQPKAGWKPSKQRIADVIRERAMDFSYPVKLEIDQANYLAKYVLDEFPASPDQEGKDNG